MRKHAHINPELQEKKKRLDTTANGFNFHTLELRTLDAGSQIPDDLASKTHAAASSPASQRMLSFGLFCLL